MSLEFNDVLVRGEKQEPFKGCFNRRYAAVNVSYEYEKRAFLKGLLKHRLNGSCLSPRTRTRLNLRKVLDLV